MRAVQLYIKLGRRVKATIRQLGYATKNALKQWCREYERGPGLSAGYVRTKRRYSDEQKRIAVEHYLSHGRCIAKFDDHLPLYRLNEIFARMGADIPDSTLVEWCGRAMQVLQPLIERIETAIMSSDLLHADDTPIRVLDRSLRDKGLGKGVKKGRIWT